MDLIDRKYRILQAIIDDYILTALPVGSRTISRKYEQKLSSATIRNEMSELEELGYLEKPHISAGRVPSAQAYRLYVNELMDRYRIAGREVQQMRRQIEDRMAELDDILHTASQVISELTDHTAVSWVTRSGEVKVTRVQLIPMDRHACAVVLVQGERVRSKVLKLYSPVSERELSGLTEAFNLALQRSGLEELVRTAETVCGPMSSMYRICAQTLEFIRETEQRSRGGELFVDGASKLLDNVEYQDPDKAKRLLDFITDKDKMRDLAATGRPNTINIRIGPETGDPMLRDASFVFTTYQLDDNTRGVIGVVAPTRMDYAAASAKLAALVQNLYELKYNKEMDLGDKDD